MNADKAKLILKNELKFTNGDIGNLAILESSLLEYNAKYNLISKNTENLIWSRHILDSAQLIKYFSTDSKSILADFGTGAGFPGLVLAIFNKNPDFHVKLYEKSPVKRKFLAAVKEKININVEILGDLHDNVIDADIIVSRAFKKLNKIISISRETINKPHKLIILKGKNAQHEINNVSLASNYSYKLENSITDADSKIIVLNVK